MSGWDLLLVVLRKLSKLNYFQPLHPIFDFIFLFGYFISRHKYFKYNK